MNRHTTTARPDSEIERLLGQLGKEGQNFLRERFRQIRKGARPDEREMLHYKVLSRAEVIQQASQFTFSRAGAAARPNWNTTMRSACWNTWSIRACGMKYANN